MSEESSSLSTREAAEIAECGARHISSLMEKEATLTGFGLDKPTMIGTLDNFMVKLRAHCFFW